MPNNDEKKVLLKVTDLKQWFPLKKTKLFQKEQEYVRANDGITLNIYEGETVGLVGESGCGKSTFGRTLLQIYKQTEGKTMYYGRTLTDMAPLYVDETIKNISSGKKKIIIPENRNMKRIIPKLTLASFALFLVKFSPRIFFNSLRIIIKTPCHSQLGRKRFQLLNNILKTWVILKRKKRFVVFY